MGTEDQTSYSCADFSFADKDNVSFDGRPDCFFFFDLYDCSP